MVRVLLATYNGASFLARQLQSLLDQTSSDFQILARDDGSVDRSRHLLEEWHRKYPDKLELVVDPERGLGARGNFARLMELTLASQTPTPYIMFCDQDDVWLPGKIEQTLERMQALEHDLGRQTPILVCSDLSVVDEHLQTIAPSLAAYQHLEPTSGQPWRRLLVQNFVTGCTIMINRALLEKATPVPPEARMHDWWLALVAGVFGHVEYMPTPTILYRQHSNNDTGATAWRLSTIRRKTTTTQHSIRSSQQQAKAFHARFKDKTPRVIREFADLSAHGFLSRRLWVWRNKVAYTGLVRNLGFWLFV